jgi:hypothetical protein
LRVTLGVDSIAEHVDEFLAALPSLIEKSRILSHR